jgi:parallel beta-helix repeat protein
MEKKIVSAITLTLLLTGMLTLAFNIQPVKASGTIYIRVDGSIDPPTANITTADNITYTFTDNNYDGIVVERGNIVIDGNGYTLQGTGSGSGFYWSGINNVTIKNTKIRGFYHGIYLEYSNNNSISGNNITANNEVGIELYGSSNNNSIYGNNIANNGYGIYLRYSSNNSIYENNITANNYDGIRVDYLSSNNIISRNDIRNNNAFGIIIGSNNNVVSENNITENGYIGLTLDFSSNNTVSGNALKGNKLNFYVGGDKLDHYIHSIDDSNLVDGKPVYYLINQTDTVISSSTYPHVGWLALINCSKVDVTGLTLSNNGKGLLLAYTNNSRIKGNNVINNEYGIYIDWSSNCSISENNVTNSYAGIWLRCSSYTNVSANNITNNNHGINFYEALDSNISGNNITKNDWEGVNLEYSSNNTISANIIAENSYGINLYVSLNNMISGNNIKANNRGIQLAYSSSNNIFENNIANSVYGIDLYDLSNYNMISGNNIANSYTGIRARAVYDSSFPLNNSFFHNSFIDNTIQVDTQNSMNIWDDGYPSGGNYWSDYTGVDVKSGPGQDLHGSDSIGDVPYIIDADNVDHYPLMNAYGAPPLQTYSLAIISTVGGTTDPAPGTYSYTANSTVEVTAIPSANYLFDHWELDSVNVGSANPCTVLMDKNHTLKAVFSTVPPPLLASISPPSASINIGLSVTFTSTVSGGYTPYSYQWYLNGAPVSGATSNTWTFTPTTSGIYYVHLKVTDAKANTAQSDAARIAVATVPVGGYSIQIQVPAKAEPVLPYIASIAALTAIFTKLRPKTKRKH